MVAHEFVHIEDGTFVCVNCGVVRISKRRPRRGVCKPCTFCKRVHICHEIGKTPWSMGLESTSSRECCWLAEKE